jgi:hypothetical protein
MMACTSQLQVIVSIMLWMATRRAALNALPRVSTAGMAPTLRISLMAQVSFIGLSTSAFTLCAPKPTNGAKKPDAPAKPVKPAAKRGRSASAPHTRPPAPAEPAISQLPLVLDGELYPLPDGKDYQSADELDGPAHVLEEEELVGLEPRAPIQSPEGAPAAQRQASPTRSQFVATGAPETTKKLSASQQRHLEDMAKWSPLKTDGTETRSFIRPAFQPYKEGSAPAGFVAGPEHERGGPRPEFQSRLTPLTHPAILMAHMGFDARLFNQFWSGTNDYAASKGTGTPDFWKHYRPFGKEEIICGCGLLLRNGVAPSPDMTKVFSNPLESFVFGDQRVRDVWKGEQCGGSERRWIQFRSFFHIQKLL